MISGGGTGGHIFPAIAIADALKQRYPRSEFLFIGAQDRMEMQRVPAAGYEIKGIWISGIQRKLTAENLSFPFKLLSSLAKCRRFIRKFKPDAVIGTGGFASGPLLFVASRMNIPCVIQEQNSFPGITNKLLAPKAKKICVAYPNMERFFPKEKIEFTGNPIRNAIKKMHQNKTKEHTQLNLLVLGGSLGARRINQLMDIYLDDLLKLSINIRWQTGKLYIAELLQKHGSKQNEQLQISPFIDDMAQAYKDADMIISRAGAGTLSELAVAAKPVLLIPSPNVAEDHQTKNAISLVEQNAAIIYRESEPEKNFLEKVTELTQNIPLRNALANKLGSLALPKADETIADEVLKLIHAR